MRLSGATARNHTRTADVRYESGAGLGTAETANAVVQGKDSATRVAAALGNGVGTDIDSMNVYHGKQKRHRHCRSHHRSLFNHYTCSVV